MAIGFYARKRDFLDEAVSKKLSKVLLKITNPLLVIHSFQIGFTDEILHNVITVFIFAIAAHTLSALLGQVLFRRYEGRTRSVMKFSAIYSNCAFMGFPILDSLFGKVGILFGSTYTAAFNIFLWTNGVVLFSDKKKMDGDMVKKTLLNPGILSVVIGLLIALFSISLPYPVARTVELVGSMTTPLSMLMIGSTLSDCDLKKLLQGFELYYATGVRLLFIPLLTYGVLKLLGFSGVLLSVCVLMVAMPVAATTTIFAKMYDGDSRFASRLVAFSTLASMATIPLIMQLH